MLSKLFAFTVGGGGSFHSCGLTSMMRGFTSNKMKKFSFPLSVSGMFDVAETEC